MSISTSLRKGIVVLVTLSCLPALASTEQEQLAQAIKQLEAAKLSLQRAEKVAKASPKTREYFNYSAIHSDIETVKKEFNNISIQAEHYLVIRMYYVH